MHMKKDPTNQESQCAPQSLEKGAIDIAKALLGTYKDVQGKLKCVGGDMTKVRYVPGLSSAAQLLLTNMSHTTRQIQCTQETRIMMRSATQAYRIRYETPCS